MIKTTRIATLSLRLTKREHGYSKPEVEYSAKYWDEYQQEIAAQEPLFTNKSGLLRFVFSTTVLKKHGIAVNSLPQEIKALVLSGDTGTALGGRESTCLILTLRDTPQVSLVLPLMFLLASGPYAQSFTPVAVDEHPTDADKVRIGGGAWNQPYYWRYSPLYVFRTWLGGFIDTDKLTAHGEKADEDECKARSDLEALKNSEGKIVLPSGESFDSTDAAVRAQLLGFPMAKCLRDDWLDYVRIKINGATHELSAVCSDCPQQLRRNVSYHCAPCVINCEKVCTAKELFGFSTKKLFSLQLFDAAAKRVASIAALREESHSWDNPTATMPYKSFCGYDPYRMKASALDTVGLQHVKLSASAARAATTRKMRTSVCTSCVLRSCGEGNNSLCPLAQTSGCSGPYTYNDILEAIDPTGTLRKPKSSDYLYFIDTDQPTRVHIDRLPLIKAKLCPKHIHRNQEDEDVHICVIDIQKIFASKRAFLAEIGICRKTTVDYVTLQCDEAQIRELLATKAIHLCKRALDKAQTPNTVWGSICLALLHKYPLWRVVSHDDSNELQLVGVAGNYRAVAKRTQLLSVRRYGGYSNVALMNTREISCSENAQYAIAFGDEVLRVSDDPDVDFLPENRKKENLWLRTKALRNKSR